MKIKITMVGDGLHSSEKIVEIDTRDGPVRLTVDHSYIDDNSLEIGYPISKSNGHVLVELPRETPTGQWRVWVSRGDVLGAHHLEDAF